MKKEVIGNATLYLGDCIDLMKQFPDKHFDLAIVDPPYGLKVFTKKNGGNSKKIKCFGKKTDKWNNTKPDKNYFQELFRVSKYQIIWGRNNFTLPESEYFIVWDKGEGFPSFAQCELAWTSCHIPAKIFRHRWRGNSRDSERNIKRIHPTQKPVALYKWLLSKYAKPGDKILDTHLGSGSIAIACNELGFNLTAIEIDEDYFNAACKRIQRAVSECLWQ
jgi:site-specific DNA-methyltransferase (adenine-specific)